MTTRRVRTGAVVVFVILWILFGDLAIYLNIAFMILLLALSFRPQILVRIITHKSR